MEISKKELLKETGISYGQLYRWKREGLIPEEWFVKRSSFTGQETYFPKEEILKRIEMIQQLKDHYSLEEMAKMLTPSVSNRLFHCDDLEAINEITLDVATSFMNVFEKDEFDFSELLFMVAMSKCIDEEQLSDDNLQTMITHIAKALKQLEPLNQITMLVKIQEEYFLMLRQAGSTIILDDRIIVIQEVNLQELSNTIKMKYQHIFHFNS